MIPVPYLTVFVSFAWYALCSDQHLALPCFVAQSTNTITMPLALSVEAQAERSSTLCHYL